MESSSTLVAEGALEEPHIRAGMAIMQTVYAVAMTLGFKNVVEASYGLFVPPTSSNPGTLPLYVVAFAFVAVMLLAVRFFWVPRNLYSYLLTSSNKPRERVFRRVTMIHFPIALVHALLFSFVCRAYVDMAVSPAHHAHSSADFAFRFVALYAGLLLVNAAWLLSIRSRNDPKPGSVWAYNNLCCAWLTVGAIAALEKHELSTVTFVLAACVIFFANSVVDLWKTAPYYILFHSEANKAGA